MKRALLPLAALALLGACAQLPTGPSVMVMPAANKPFEVFMAEDEQCRAWGQRAIGGGQVADSANASLATSAAAGTVLGAAAGALAGGSGEAAGVGAAVGMVTAAAVGSDSARYAGSEAQRRYDTAYLQCMYAKGNQVPATPAPAATVTHYYRYYYDRPPVVIVPGPPPRW
ncbi:glycine zipper family protein [Derxia gummosa]|uniref:Glycine zipper family protein n=1 Tax=Derxia gummosa DSM 723 TaxID=1121388 RepID=A0A8B6X829_9BURK|nr:glycine zipper family protein [Derxia gummosa]